MQPQELVKYGRNIIEFDDGEICYERRLECEFDKSTLLIHAWYHVETSLKPDGSLKYSHRERLLSSEAKTKMDDLQWSMADWLTEIYKVAR